MERYRYAKVQRSGEYIYTETYERAETDIDNPNVVSTTFRTVTIIDPVKKVASLTAERAELQAIAQALQARINAIQNLGIGLANERNK